MIKTLGKQKNRQTDGQTDRQTDKPTDRQTNRKTNRSTDRQLPLKRANVLIMSEQRNFERKCQSYEKKRRKRKVLLGQGF